MYSKQKRTGNASSMTAGLGCGVGMSVGITLAAIALIAKLVLSQYIEEKNTGYWIMAVLMCAAFVGAITAASKIKRRRAAVCVMSGLLYYGVLLAMTALFFGGQYEAVGVTGLLIMSGAVLAAMIGGPGKRGGDLEKSGLQIVNLYKNRRG